MLMKKMATNLDIQPPNLTKVKSGVARCPELLIFLQSARTASLVLLWKSEQ